MNNTFHSGLIGALPGALLGLLPIILTAFFEWRERRDLIGQRNLAIEVAHKRVSFLSDLMRAYEVCAHDNVSYLRHEIAQDLSKLKKELTETLNEIAYQAVHQSKFRGKRNIFHHICLAYKPVGATAWMLHLLFYMMAGIGLVLIWAGGFPGEEASEEVWTMGEFIRYLPLTIPMALIALGPPMACVNWLAHRADRRAMKARQEIQTSYRDRHAH